MENNFNNRPSISPTAIVVAAVYLLVSVIGINWFTSFVPGIFPPQASAESKSVDELFVILVIIGGVVFFLIQGMLLISVIAFRARPGDNRDGPTYHGNMILEIVWTIIPATVVIFLAVISFDVWSQNSAPKANVNMVNGASIPVNVTGARFAWTHTYETGRNTPDGAPIVINSGNTLHTYIGQNVDLTLQTQDVIHSYWVPAMRVKQDLLPGDPKKGGRPTELRFTPIRVEDETYPAKYPIVCAELCGDGHGRMTGTVMVYEDETQYLEQFYEPAIHAILNPPADPVLRGEIVIQEYICNSCHILDSLGWEGRTGPAMNGIADRAGERVPGQSAEEYIVTSVWDAEAFLVPGYTDQMAQFGPDQDGMDHMSAEELYAIVAYLCTQGEQSDCDMENSSTAIPDAIEMVYGIEVDINFGQGDGETAEETPSEDTGESSSASLPDTSASTADDTDDSAAAQSDDEATDADMGGDSESSSASLPDASASTANDTDDSAAVPGEGRTGIAGIRIIVIGDCTLADAITAANENKETGGCPAGSDADTIVLAADIVLRQALPQLRSNITIEGGNYTISGDGRNRIFSIAEDARLTLRNLNLTNGSASRGGAIHNKGIVIIIDCGFNDNSATIDGGAIANDGEASISNSSFNGNSSNDYGGAIVNSEEASISITDSDFKENETGEGGAIHNRGEANVSGSTLERNSADEGGAIFTDTASGAITRLRDTKLVDNPGGDCVGGLEETVNNTSEDGGCASSPAPAPTPILILDKDIVVGGGCRLEDAIRAANRGRRVGRCVGRRDANTIVMSESVTLRGTLEISSDITIEGNGHAINGNKKYRLFRVEENGVLTINNLTLADGGAKDDGEFGNYLGDGGAIFNHGKVIVSNSNFTGSLVGEDGGAIRNTGELSISNSAFRGNSAARYGGAIYNQGGYDEKNVAIFTITNSTFSDNSADQGGAIGSVGQASSTVRQSTFMHNSAGENGGGLYLWGWQSDTGKINHSRLLLNDSIFAGNQGGDCLLQDYGILEESSGNNYIKDGSCKARWSRSDATAPDYCPPRQMQDGVCQIGATEFTSAPAPVLEGDGAVSCGDTVTGGISDGDWLDLWSFEGIAGQTVEIIMTSEEIDSYLILRGPGGEELVSNDNTGLTEVHIPTPYDAGIFSYKIEDSATYTIEATRYGDANGGTSGVYKLFIRCDTAYSLLGNGAVSCGDTVTGNISDEDWMDEWSVASTTVQTITISMRGIGTGELDSYLIFLSPHGVFGAGNPRGEFASDDNSGGGNDARITYAIHDLDSAHYIRATRNQGAYGSTSGDYELSVLCR